MSLTSAPPTVSSRLQYLIILDFEATCDDQDPTFNVEQEVIEFPALFYNLESDTVVDTFHHYVRPVLRPTLTDFCKVLTGIQQGTVDGALTFPEVWAALLELLEKKELAKDPDTFVFVTCGDWDLKQMLPKQIKHCAKTLTLDGQIPPYFRRWINLKPAFRSLYGPPPVKGMTNMLRRQGLVLEGRHHSGIDDCRNLARIVRQMRRDTWKPSLHDVRT